MEKRKKRILIVDDEPLNLRMVQFALKEEIDLEISCARSGEAALEMMKNTPFDFVLLDVKMPEMDGFETLKRIREISLVPVVFLTADEDTEQMKKQSNYEVSDCLMKPVLPKVLKECIQNILDK